MNGRNVRLKAGNGRWDCLNVASKCRKVIRKMSEGFETEFSEDNGAGR